MHHLRKKARRLNAALYTLDRVYLENEKKTGVKNSEVCLVYALDDGKPHSQKQICVDWEIPSSTLNSIIKQWERLGYLELHPIPGKRRDMQIILTEAGRAHAKPWLDTIYRAEEQAMAKVLEKYPDEFIDAMELFHKELENAFTKQTTLKEEE